MNLDTMQREFTEADYLEIELRDRQSAARHEAGHLTVACAYGLHARAEIKPSEDWRKTALENKAWSGRVSYLLLTNAACIAAQKASGMIATAGPIAELLPDLDYDEYDLEFDYIVDQLVDAWDSGDLSETDRRMMPNNARDIVRAAIKAERLLRHHHAFFRWATAQLIAFEYITDGEAADVFKAKAKLTKRK